MFPESGVEIHIPVAWILMPRKNTATYRKTFDAFVDIFGANLIKFLMMDFEPALIEQAASVSKIFKMCHIFIYSKFATFPFIQIFKFRC